MKIGRLLLRLSVGGFFFGHGTQKLFGWFGGHGLDATAECFEQLGLRPGKRNAIAAGAAEAGGGALLALGLATPLAGAALTGTMLTAIDRVHAKNGPVGDQRRLRVQRRADRCGAGARRGRARRALARRGARPRTLRPGLGARGAARRRCGAVGAHYAAAASPPAPADRPPRAARRTRARAPPRRRSPTASVTRDSVVGRIRAGRSPSGDHPNRGGPAPCLQSRKAERSPVVHCRSSQRWPRPSACSRWRAAAAPRHHHSSTPSTATTATSSPAATTTSSSTSAASSARARSEHRRPAEYNTTSLSANAGKVSIDFTNMAPLATT